MCVCVCVIDLYGQQASQCVSNRMSDNTGTGNQQGVCELDTRTYTH